MEAIVTLRRLWRQRRLVALVAFAAILVWLMLTYRVTLPPESREHEVGVATAQILVDTPYSQVVNIASAGSETLVAQASLLAYLMTEGDVKAAIARRAGLRPKQVIGVAEAAVTSQADVSNAKRGPEDSVLTTRLVTESDSGSLPIIQIETEAPDTRRAVRLANAAVAGLRAYLDSKAAVEDVSERRRLRVTGIGAAQAAPVVRGPRSVITFGAAIVVFLIGCAIILLAPTIARAWRADSELDESDDVVHYGEFLHPLDEIRPESLAANETEAHLAQRPTLPAHSEASPLPQPVYGVRAEQPGARGCWARKRNGELCGAAHRTDSDYCNAHSPPWGEPAQAG